MTSSSDSWNTSWRPSTIGISEGRCAGCRRKARVRCETRSKIHSFIPRYIKYLPHARMGTCPSHDPPCLEQSVRFPEHIWQHFSHHCRGNNATISVNIDWWPRKLTDLSNVSKPRLAATYPVGFSNPSAATYRPRLLLQEINLL